MRIEAFPQGDVDLIEMKILAIVGTEHCEIQCHRKGKGSLAMQFSQGLVGPNRSPNRSEGKGKQVNIPVLFLYVR